MQVQFLKENSKIFTPSRLRSLTRADAFECCLPRTKRIRESSCCITGYEVPQTEQLLDGFNMSSIPPEQQLTQWKEQIGRSNLELEMYKSDPKPIRIRSDPIGFFRISDQVRSFRIGSDRIKLFCSRIGSD